MVKENALFVWKIRKLSAYEVDEIIAEALRVFSQGTKLAIEVALMGGDSGLVRTDEDAIAVGRTELGSRY